MGHESFINIETAEVQIKKLLVELVELKTNETLIPSFKHGD